MICDRTAQIDIRKLVKRFGQMPGVLLLKGKIVSTTWTDTNFGGRRQWFLCPSCDRRCAIIYRTGFFWGCRICMNGHYESEHKSTWKRRVQKAFKIRERLGQMKGGLNTPFPEKPKGMHWRTYQKIRIDAKRLEFEVLIEALAAIYGMGVDETLEKIVSERAL